ncbi:class C beta-lactamase-related serine hydrolase [Dyella solisilvae]|uniref:Class C beta-lactamase-related serine hydrolase n=1 Tax=Dyella solisilvae TaxID=1920168 RepID=A0A370K3P6_9GAMM|nr:serine hydrolase [Dyella solisilvae]RDI97275.1 class C beta-lactamase-related serine hydrolase [Dyella solisilvae]
MNPAAGRYAAWQGCLRRALATFALTLSPLLAQAQAQIQITPLPEQKHAAVTQIGANELSASDLQPWLDAQMNDVMRQGAVTGAVAVVVKDGEIVLSRGYGYADAGAKKPVDPETSMFRVGSISKLFTWTAVMQLVEKHKLDLDADINLYLDFPIPPRDGKPITLRDLMTHTAGFEDALKDRYATSPATLLPFDTWLKRWVPTRIHPSGDVPAYSTYGAALAGYIVQRVSGQPFDDYIERHILEPLEMKHSSFRQPLPDALQADVMPAYGQPDAPPRPFDLRTAVPAGALSASGDDMARFMIAHLQYGRSGNAQLLEQATVRQMQDNQRAAIPGLPGMALGFLRMDRNGQVILGHGGEVGGFHSLLMLFPEHHTGIFIATDGGHAAPLLRPLMERFADRHFPPLPQLRQPTLATDKVHGAQLAGRYLPSVISQDNLLALPDALGQLSIGMAADGTLQAPMFGPAHWREVQPYVWVDDATGRRLGVVMHDGKPVMLSIDTQSPVRVYLPATGWTPTQIALSALVPIVLFIALVLSWPVEALLRRRPQKALPDEDVRWYRLSRLTAVLYLLFAIGWRLMLFRLILPGLDLRLRLLQLVGVLAVFGSVAVAIETWRAWRSKGGWWRRISDVLLLLACLGAIAFIVRWRLLALNINY